MPKPVKRILIADFAPVKFNGVIHWFLKDNIACNTTTTIDDCVEKLKVEHYDLCIVNLLFAGLGPYALVKDIKKHSKNREIVVILASKQVHQANIKNVLHAGAQDFIAEPFEDENLYNRILYHLSPKTVVDSIGYERTEGGQFKGYIKLLLKSIELLSRTDHASAHGAMLKTLENTAKLLESNRSSLIIVDKENSTGVVLASSDDPSFRDFPINLNNYPEVLHVVNTGTIVLVDDTSRHFLTKKIQGSVKSIDIGSMMVFPVRFKAEIVGVLVIRRPKARELPPMEVLSILQALANVLATHSNLSFLLRKIYSDFAANE